MDDDECHSRFVIGGRIFCGYLSSGRCLYLHWGKEMSFITILSGIVSVLLLIYLMYALIKPENF